MLNLTTLEVTNLIAIIALIVTWIVFRMTAWSKRQSTVKGVASELDLHKHWVGNEYTTAITFDPTWKFLNYVVFRISTVAIDNAIAQGDEVLLNKKLIERLVGYRQRAIQLNQLIDVAAQFQSNGELWKSNPTSSHKHRMHDLICQMHWYGIGDSKGDSAYKHFKLLEVELLKESNSKFLPLIWFFTGINIFWIKRLPIWRYI